MAKWKKKRQRRPAAEQPQDPNIYRAKPPKQRLKKLLDFARQVAVEAESQVIGMRLPSDPAEHALLQFELAMLARGTNSLKVPDISKVRLSVSRSVEPKDRHCG